MRSLNSLSPILIIASIVLFPLSTQAQVETSQTAQVAFIERRGMLAVDARCNILSPEARSTLEIGTAHARGRLLIAGWSAAEVRAAEIETLNAANRRDCADPRNAHAVAEAEQTYASWSRLASMDFRGPERVWTARHVPDADGWLIRQNGPGATLGLRGTTEEPRLAISLPLSPNTPGPAMAALIMRDPERAAFNARLIPGRPATGLARYAPITGAATVTLANEREESAPSDANARIWFYFPHEAYAKMRILDPREAIELRFNKGAVSTSVLFEVGELTAAHAFVQLKTATP